MSKVTYNGHDFCITRDGMASFASYDIYDDKGYRLVENFDLAKLKQFQGAIELSGADDNLKLVLDFAPYAVDSHTLRNNERHHSLWAKPDYSLSKFWKCLELM